MRKIGKHKSVDLHYAFCQGCKDKPIHTSHYILTKNIGGKLIRIGICEDFRRKNKIAEFSSTIKPIIKS